MTEVITNRLKKRDWPAVRASTMTMFDRGEMMAKKRRLVKSQCEIKTSAGVESSTTEVVVSSLPSLDSIPEELFQVVLSYLGPTSSSLSVLAQVTTYHNKMMKVIGDSMLSRAKKDFRMPLPPKSSSESSVSLFVRHARSCRDVFENLVKLQHTLDKDFDAMGDDEERSRSTRSLNENSTTAITMQEMSRAIELALDLLLSVAIGGRCSTALEWRVLALCGKCGGKVFKYCKTKLRRDRQELVNAFDPSGVVARENSNHVLEVHHVEEDVGPAKEENSDTRIKRLETWMGKSRLIMQLVLLRDLELSRELAMESSLSRRCSLALSSYKSSLAMIENPVGAVANAVQSSTWTSSIPPPLLRGENRSVRRYAHEGDMSLATLLTLQLKQQVLADVVSMTQLESDTRTHWQGGKDSSTRRKQILKALIG